MREGVAVVNTVVPHQRPQTTMVDVARAWAPSTFRAIGPGPQLQGMPDGLAALHNGANTEVTRGGGKSGGLIVEIGGVGVQLQMLAGEAALGATARAALTTASTTATRQVASTAEGATAIASSGERSVPATVVREIRHGEKVSTLVNELAERTYTSGGMEHAIISTRGGQRLIVQGGSGGMSFTGFDLRRVLLHSHTPEPNRTIWNRFPDAPADRTAQFVGVRVVWWRSYAIQEAVMAIIIQGKTPCPLCARALGGSDDIVSFPAFVRPEHELGQFSDAAFHRVCFESDPRAAKVEALYERYRTIWDSRPKALRTLEEFEAWGRDAFKDFP